MGSKCHQSVCFSPCIACGLILDKSWPRRFLIRGASVCVDDPRLSPSNAANEFNVSSKAAMTSSSARIPVQLQNP